jgi:hypothetical protein
VISDKRFRSFDKALEDVLNSIPTPLHTASRPRDLHPNQSNSNTNSTHSQANIRTVQAANELNILNTKMLHEEVSKKLGRWYVQRHGVRADGNVEEMATLIQVTIPAIPPSRSLSLSLSLVFAHSLSQYVFTLVSLTLSLLICDLFF